MIIKFKSPFLFLKAMFNVFKDDIEGKPVFVAEKIEKQRQDICNSCDFNDNGQCTKCTCYIGAKIMLPHEKCPAGYWLEA